MFYEVTRYVGIILEIIVLRICYNDGNDCYCVAGSGADLWILSNYNGPDKRYKTGTTFTPPPNPCHNLIENLRDQFYSKEVMIKTFRKFCRKYSNKLQ